MFRRASIGLAPTLCRSPGKPDRSGDQRAEDQTRHVYRTPLRQVRTPAKVSRFVRTVGADERKERTSRDNRGTRTHDDPLPGTFADRVRGSAQ